jgi:gamma-glutamylcyclotransferase (GGCT)/AIG2-like uncharacterized protein YtfP
MSDGGIGSDGGALLRLRREPATSVMARRCPRHRVVGAAQLWDHLRASLRRSLTWRAAVLDIVSSPGDAVWGALYDVPEAELSALDEAEASGLPTGAARWRSSAMETDSWRWPTS